MMKYGVYLEQFEHSKHTLLCEELKHLYTAITRCRKSLVFFDSDKEKSAPFFNHLKSRGLADSSLDGGSFQQWSVGTEKNMQEWIRRGREFLDRNELVMAKHCFEKGDSPVWTSVTDAKVSTIHIKNIHRSLCDCSHGSERSERSSSFKFRKGSWD